MSTTSPHLTNIPEAVRIAASVDSHIDPSLKQQAVEYLQKVKELCEETWQDCLSLYIQGAGVAGPSSTGKDGKEKLGTDLRMYCEQVVDTVLTSKPQVMTSNAQQATYTALVDFVQTEWVNGPCEGGEAYLRNKLAFTLAHLFINVYPSPLPTFLHPFLTLLTPPDPSSSKPNFHPPLLTIRLLTEIALEIHDSTMRSARVWSASRQQRDGEIRDLIRTSGDERLAVEGLLSLAAKTLDTIESGSTTDRQKWVELAEQAMRTLAAWTPWVDLAVTLTPQTLAFYSRLLDQGITSLRIPAASLLKTLVGKGIKDPAEKLQVLKILNVVSLLDPLEASTRETKGDSELVAYRVAIGGILQVFGSELVSFVDNNDNPESLRNEAQIMMNNAFPLLIRFLSDRQSEVPLSVSPFISDLLRMLKKIHTIKPAPISQAKGVMAPPPSPPTPLSDHRRQFLSTLLDVSVRQLAWPDDAEWESRSSEEADLDDEIATFRLMRTTCRTFIESIAAIDKSLHTDVVAGIVVSTLETLQGRGSSAVPWQQAELAMHLVYTFGELNKNNSRAAFFELPAELNSKAGRDRVRRISINKSHIDAAMSSGRSTPTSTDGMSEDALAEVQPGIYYGGKERINYEQYPPTPLGQLLSLCVSSGISNYPHPGVTLQYFETAVRYVEFWKAKDGLIQPMFEAMLDQRGIHHSDEGVRRRCFYLFARFVKECRVEMDPEMASPILESLRDMMVIQAKLPEPDTPDDDLLTKATTGHSYLSDQLHLFEASGNLVYLTRGDSTRVMSLLEAVAGPLMSNIGDGLQRPNDLQAVLQAHHNLLALGNFAKGFPQVVDPQVESLPYQPAFKQMTEALLEALDVMKTQRIVRDSARYAFSQFVNAIGQTVAELVPKFVSHVVTEFEPSELVDFMTFLGLLMHRLKKNTFETMDMLLLPLLSRIFSVLQQPITGTDEAHIHRRLKDSYLSFFTALMNANLDGIFITSRNNAEFENVLSALLKLASDSSDGGSQRLAISFFARSVIAWGTSPKAAAAPSVFADSASSEKSKAVANGTSAPTNHHATPREERAAQALPGYETFIYQRLLPLCFEVPANPKFNVRGGQAVLYEIAMLLRNTVQARGQEAIDFLLHDLLPKLQCPNDVANQLIQSLRTQQSRDFRKTFVEFIKMLKS